MLALTLLIRHLKKFDTFSALAKFTKENMFLDEVKKDLIIFDTDGKKAKTEETTLFSRNEVGYRLCGGGHKCYEFRQKARAEAKVT